MVCFTSNQAIKPSFQRFSMSLLLMTKSPRTRYKGMNGYWTILETKTVFINKNWLNERREWIDINKAILMVIKITTLVYDHYFFNNINKTMY